MRRLYFSLDVDAFYAAVEEHDDPSLRNIPFCVVQKHVVATLSYPARQLGFRKLCTINEVKRRYPNMRMVNGENLAKYTAAGKMLFTWLQDILRCPVERLGLEEMRVELTDSVRYNIERGSLKHLKQLETSGLWDDAGEGVTLQFSGTGTTIECLDFFFKFDGVTIPPGNNEYQNAISAGYLDAYVAGHLACYLRDRMFLELGYSCSIGVGSTITYAKVACGYNKPNGVTVLLPGHEREFVSSLPLRSIPGFGSATCRLLRDRLGLEESITLTGETLISMATRQRFINWDLDPALWDIVAGKDQPSDISTRHAPSQVSVEDTYPIKGPENPQREVNRLVDSLILKVNSDLVENGCWIAVPRLFILSVKTSSPNAKISHWARRSKSKKITLPTGDTIEERLKSLGSTLKHIASQLLRELAGRDPFRLLNVCLKVQPSQ